MASTSPRPFCNTQFFIQCRDDNRTITLGPKNLFTTDSEVSVATIESAYCQEFVRVLTEDIDYNVRQDKILCWPEDDLKLEIKHERSWNAALQEMHVSAFTRLVFSLQRSCSGIGRKPLYLIMCYSNTQVAQLTQSRVVSAGNHRPRINNESNKRRRKQDELPQQSSKSSNMQKIAVSSRECRSLIGQDASAESANPFSTPLHPQDAQVEE